jgi:hypothetical protein
LVISSEYRYVFIEIPLTASWAIHHELCAHYGGEEILHKHATYPQFMRGATADQRSYFVFASVRHPLDVLVSNFTKIKTDHRDGYSNPLAAEKLLSDYSDLRKHQWIQAHNASFASYFSKYHRRPYSGLIDYSATALDYVIRFESLQQDFSRVLEMLGIEQVQPLPIVNRTEKKKATWQSYYTPEILGQAMKVCGPYMQRWGYDFPEGWGPHEPNWLDAVQYRFYNFLRSNYVNHFKYNTEFLGRSVRKLRAFFE